MLYHIFYPLRDWFFGFNVFQYITVRAGAGALTAFLAVIIFTPALIRKLKALQIREKIHPLTPPAHKGKEGTPTMGGIIIIVSMLLSTLLWQRWDNRFTWILVTALFYLGVLGFIDDTMKLKDKKGLSVRSKIIGQVVLGLALGVYLYFFPISPEWKNSIGVPFFKNVRIFLGVFYIFFVLIVITASSNAVNLSDGLDGLAAGVLIFVAFSYLIMTYVAGNVKFSGYLLVPYIRESGEITIMLSSLVGSTLGFLWYNAYPAEIFMGDTGSLPLGGIVGITALLIKQELILLLVGGVFVLEAASVILQVAYFKKFKKRIFRMAPLHHHFELKGWAEPKVVVRFWIISIVFMLIALMTLKLR
ncbi:MAG TPA: phospho-N-acetylmuramoyl-pentapeptide-transferase [bacterium]|nr:phospho-N-acetylmuramoyl-pentapeptide-transferase [bacterium]